ncbi:MAG: hypothetical protein WD738_19945 [Pirellulales bacterium]
MTRSFISVSILLMLFAATVGCGGKELAEVRGKVTFGGQPVTSGVLVFSPIAKSEDQAPGKSSTGDIQPDGSFQLSTHQIHDGAIVGRHRVRFIPSIDDDEKVDSPRMTSSDYSHLTLPADYVTEVESGKDNEINIELVQRSAQ